MAAEIAYAARYGKQHFPWMTTRLSRLLAFNAAIVKLVEIENKDKPRDEDKE